MKILQICHKMPWPANDGGSSSLYTNAIGLLNRGIEVKVFAINTPQHYIDPSSLPKDFSEKSNFESHLVDTRIKLIKAFGNIFRRQSYFVERFWESKFNKKLIRLFQSENFDIVQLEHSYLGLYIKTIQQYSKARIVLRPQNAEFEVWQRIQKMENNPLRKLFLSIATNRLYSFEKETAGQVDGIIAISDRDAKTFQKLAPGTSIFVLPVSIDFSKIENSNYKKNVKNPPVFYHLGSMDWTPNLQGMNWFINEVMPFIIKQNPDFRFRIAGKNMPESLFKKQNNHLQVEGEIDDATFFHCENDIMLVPLLSGGGIRVKIIEAMALSKVVISTTLGAEGIPYINGENILIADTKEEFALQVKKCMDSPDLCQSIGLHGFKLARKYFDLKENIGRMIAYYEKLMSKPSLTN